MTRKHTKSLGDGLFELRAKALEGIETVRYSLNSKSKVKKSSELIIINF